MKYPLLATDLDGTLLNDEKEIDLETIEAIHEYRTTRGESRYLQRTLPAFNQMDCPYDWT